MFVKGKIEFVSVLFWGLDMLLDDTGGEGGMRREGRHVKVVVSLDEDSKWTEVKPCL